MTTVWEPRSHSYQNSPLRVLCGHQRLPYKYNDSKHKSRDVGSRYNHRLVKGWPLNRLPHFSLRGEVTEPLSLPSKDATKLSIILGLVAKHYLD